MPVVSARFDAMGRTPDGSVDASRTYRLGIMGGTFDPVHVGHLAVAEQARDEFGLDGVVFIPAGVPVFKKGTHVTPARDRLRMCELACAGNPHFDVSAIEIERGGDTYTVDTLRQLHDFYPPNVELCFITGADAVLSIMNWHESADIPRLAKLIAVSRPGYTITEECKRVLRDHADLDVRFFEATALSVSSSLLRAMVARGRSIRYLVPNEVLDYIQANELYVPKGASHAE